RGRNARSARPRPQQPPGPAAWDAAGPVGRVRPRLLEPELVAAADAHVEVAAAERLVREPDEQQVVVQEADDSHLRAVLERLPSARLRVDVEPGPLVDARQVETDQPEPLLELVLAHLAVEVDHLLHDRVPAVALPS